MADNKRNQKRSHPEENEKKENTISDQQVRQESSKAASQSLTAQKKATELKNAAAGAGDADERQKLMERAIDQQIEAESLGKTAKYMRSGTFQGMAVGTGLGVAPGASLGALTGTLVGGVTSTITGGIGGGIGAAAGALHGPFWNLGEVAGKGIQKVTGNLPGWEATEEQKKTLEKMIGQISEEDMPSQEELTGMSKDGKDGSWSSWASNALPSMQSKNDCKDVKDVEGKVATAGKKSSSGKSQGPSTAADDKENRRRPRKLNTNQDEKSTKRLSSDGGERKKPLKLETRSTNAKAPSGTASTRKSPRKLEKRT
ncbi:hypothetical protein BU24DRAFT_451409 [Aaosphaeria arxii CBS 175.79]|uniref:Glycine zipper domain-containing protein n=1 Tax=Aaosphaeria arxii CBS 175.79 TaxID=1450172 RepID=A0A6A5XM64_9PLEO|nr:uncharacterized protein BU24DRAFT_451409 [Aaosphaeria arxii CBS 175.79]KAF2014325.1 hypothetical protein BU24DRAFT_451409 [Aaosphaeria arxii CBS 175.79]